MQGIAQQIALQELRLAQEERTDTASTAQSPEHAAIVSDWGSAVGRAIDAISTSSLPVRPYRSHLCDDASFS
jgi:hypothetical protein